jgi:hypothetical protein
VEISSQEGGVLMGFPRGSPAASRRRRTGRSGAPRFWESNSERIARPAPTIAGIGGAAGRRVWSNSFGEVGQSSGDLFPGQFVGGDCEYEFLGSVDVEVRRDAVSVEAEQGPACRPPCRRDRIERRDNRACRCGRTRVDQLAIRRPTKSRPAPPRPRRLRRLGHKPMVGRPRRGRPRHRAEGTPQPCLRITGAISSVLHPPCRSYCVVRTLKLGPVRPVRPAITARFRHRFTRGRSLVRCPIRRLVTFLEN